MEKEQAGVLWAPKQPILPWMEVSYLKMPSGLLLLHGKACVKHALHTFTWWKRPVSCVAGVCDQVCRSVGQSPLLQSCGAFSRPSCTLHGVCSEVALPLFEFLAWSSDSMLVVFGGLWKIRAVSKTVFFGQLCLWAWIPFRFVLRLSPDDRKEEV